MKMLLAAIALVLSSHAYSGDLFKCKAKDGSTKFQDKPCDISDQLVEKKNLSEGNNSSDDLGPQFVKVNEDGSCPVYYNLVEGACVHALAVKSDTKSMIKSIDSFKTTNHSPRTKKKQNINTSDKSRCEKYKSIYEKYKSEGVTGINIATGEIKKMSGKDADEAIKNAKESADIMCGK